MQNPSTRWLTATLLAACMNASTAQMQDYSPVTDAMLHDMPAGEWLNWRGDNRAWGYSPLDQIDSSNVGQLQLQWSWALDNTGAVQAAPLVHDGIMFVPAPRGVVVALDAANGDLIWEYRPSLQTSSTDSATGRSAAMPATAFAGVGRGVQKNIALYGDRVFTATENASIVALDASTGSLLWETQVADPALGYHYTAGPVVAHGTLVTGITGCSRYKEDVCFITGHDPHTGEERWRTTTIARPGEPGGDTWGDLPLQFRAGGDAWVAGNYDPELNLVYWGTAQAKPWARAVRGTDEAALYTNSTLALNPDTGEMVWFYQHIPGESHDMDDVFENILVDIDGQKSLFKIGKLGILWQLDRETGDYINATDLGYQNIVNLDPVTGKLTYRDGMVPRIGQQIDMCPSTSGVKSWRSMAYSPQTSAVYIPMTLNCALATFGPTERVLGGGGVGPVRRNNYVHPDSDGNLGEVLAVAIPGGEVKWRFRTRAPINTATLTTAGELVFAGDWDRYFYAFSADDGEVLWQSRLTTSTQGFPISYSVAGKQYVAVPTGISGASWSSSLPRELAPELSRPGTGSAIHVFALPE